MPKGVYQRTDETKRKMSQSHIGKVGTFYGKKHSLESREKMSKARKKLFQSGYVHPNKGREWTKLSGKNHWNWQGGIAKASYPHWKNYFSQRAILQT